MNRKVLGFSIAAALGITAGTFIVSAQQKKTAATNDIHVVLSVDNNNHVTLKSIKPSGKSSVDAKGNLTLKKDDVMYADGSGRKPVYIRWEKKGKAHSEKFKTPMCDAGQTISRNANDDGADADTDRSRTCLVKAACRTVGSCKFSYGIDGADPDVIIENGIEPILGEKKK